MKKGFTMIEVMAVFTIAAIILIIAIPQMTSLLKKGKEKQMDSFKNDLFLACESYIESEKETDFKNTDFKNFVEITIKQMLDKGYLDSTITYPKTNKKFSKMTDEELNKLVINVIKDEEGYYNFEFYDNR